MRGTDLTVETEESMIEEELVGSNIYFSLDEICGE